jgi:excisionase family DNA binding protein
MKTAVIQIDQIDHFASAQDLAVLATHAVRIAPCAYRWRRPVSGGAPPAPAIPVVPASLAGLRATLDHAVVALEPTDLPAFIGELERVKAVAYARLLPLGTSPSGDAYLKIRDVVQRLNISRVRLYELIREGRITTVRFGPRGVRIRARDLARWEARAAGNGA